MGLEMVKIVLIRVIKEANREKKHFSTYISLTLIDSVTH